MKQLLVATAALAALSCAVAMSVEPEANGANITSKVTTHTTHRCPWDNCPDGCCPKPPQ